MLKYIRQSLNPKRDDRLSIIVLLAIVRFGVVVTLRVS